MLNVLYLISNCFRFVGCDCLFYQIDLLLQMVVVVTLVHSFWQRGFHRLFHKFQLYTACLASVSVNFEFCQIFFLLLEVGVVVLLTFVDSYHWFSSIKRIFIWNAAKVYPILNQIGGFFVFNFLASLRPILWFFRTWHIELFLLCFRLFWNRIWELLIPNLRG